MTYRPGGPKVWVAGPIGYLNRTTVDKRSIESLTVAPLPLPIMGFGGATSFGHRDGSIMVGEVRQVTLMDDDTLWMRGWMDPDEVLPDGQLMRVGVDVDGVIWEMRVADRLLTDNEREAFFDGFPNPQVVDVLTSGRLVAVTSYGNTRRVPAWSTAYLTVVDFEDSTPWITCPEDRQRVVWTCLPGVPADSKRTARLAP